MVKLPWVAVLALAGTAYAHPGHGAFPADSVAHHTIDHGYEWVGITVIAAMGMVACWRYFRNRS